MTYSGSMIGLPPWSGGTSPLSAEDTRRTEILTGMMQAIRPDADIHAIAQALAEQIRQLLKARLVSIVLRSAGDVRILAIAGQTDELAATVRDRYNRRGMQFISDLANRAISAGEPIAVASDPTSQALGGLIAAGMLLAAPLRTARAEGAILIYPRESGVFTAEERSLTAAVADFVSVALTDAEGGTVSLAAPEFQRGLATYASTVIQNSRQFARMEQANRRWAGVFDAISDFIVVHDASDTVLRANRALADFIGVPPQELVGVNMGVVLAWGSETPPRFCPLCRPSDDGDEAVHRVLDRTYLVSTSRTAAAGENGFHTVHVLKDITDRNEAERRYRELFDNIQEGVFFASPDGRFIEVNDALVRILGYGSREELLQAHVRTQVCASITEYDDLALRMQADGAVRNHELTLKRQDGSLIHVLVNAFAVLDSQQQTTQFRGIMLDISNLRSSQSELQRERDFSGKILHNTQSLILVIDPAGLITFANRRWQDLGFQRGELLGQPVQDLVVPARTQALEQAITQTLAGQQADNFEVLLLVDQRGSRYAVNLSPMRDDQGRINSIVVVMSDVTDTAALQAKLMHAEKMAAVGQLVSGVAHEVNNPLTAILGFADLLMENPDMPESARRDLRVILQEAQRTKQIVQNLLSFARQVPPQRKPVQVNMILRHTVQLRAYDFHSRGVEVVELLDDHLPEVIGDPQQLQQVFLNIMNNAYDAVRELGRAASIAIESIHAGNMVEVRFRDNGHGISFPERIFDPFFTTKEIGKGTGLGLSICYGIVREHGGEITCQNNQDEPGATFVVRLPAYIETASTGAVAGTLS
ncbi:MAG TPA: PAS domain S-box protein [Terriglobales bacterium]